MLFLVWHCAQSTIGSCVDRLLMYPRSAISCFISLSLGVGGGLQYLILIVFQSCKYLHLDSVVIWAASSEFGTYRLCEQRRFRRACASAQSRQNLRCSLIQAVSHEEPSDRKPDP